jgi:hypothetical protein
MSERLHRALRALPVRRAPKTLLPRVLEAAARSEDTLGAWWSWPAPARWSYAAAVALAAGLSLEAGLGLCSAAAQTLPALTALMDGVWTLTRVFWLAGGRPLLGASAAMALAFAALMTGLVRLVERPQSVLGRSV